MAITMLGDLNGSIKKMDTFDIGDNPRQSISIFYDDCASMASTTASIIQIFSRGDRYPAVHDEVAAALANNPHS
ncbi:hypothetical protein HF673_11875 [Acidithiobacillus thiooxidans]|jgi:hypothetical protein|uniref:hypothetical protein n=1 Tax=Acidithiobacillus thiooxidans TaxID=930 RepID=UPI001C0710BA|nr:hypothetical protein [Acidithiobacillus thiooxidans]MBU2836446.1 hypothetical protein [Acidithiobacillus thiooxidans]